MSRKRGRVLTTRALRRIGDHTVGRRRLAKALFWTGGQLSKVKTYQRFYTLDDVDLEATDAKSRFKSSPAGRHWSPCSLSMRFIGQSMQLDWDHWDHWATSHAHESGVVCVGTVCPDCGGDVCPLEEDWEDAR